MEKRRCGGFANFGRVKVICGELGRCKRRELAFLEFLATILEKSLFYFPWLIFLSGENCALLEQNKAGQLEKLETGKCGYVNINKSSTIVWN